MVDGYSLFQFMVQDPLNGIFTVCVLHHGQVIKNGNGFVLKKMCPEYSHAGTCYCYATLEGINARCQGEFFLERIDALSKNISIIHAVFDKFILELVNITSADFVIVPQLELFSSSPIWSGCQRSSGGIGPS